jgi:hypothetical protein
MRIEQLIFLMGMGALVWIVLIALVLLTIRFT